MKCMKACEEMYPNNKAEAMKCIMKCVEECKCLNQCPMEDSMCQEACVVNSVPISKRTGVISNIFIVQKGNGLITLTFIAVPTSEPVNTCDMKCTQSCTEMYRDDASMQMMCVEECKRKCMCMKQCAVGDEECTKACFMQPTTIYPPTMVY